MIATGTLAISAPTMISPQKKMSPRTKIGGDAECDGFLAGGGHEGQRVDEFLQGQVKVKISAVKIAGRDSGITILTKAPNKLQPSTIAASSISIGTPLKNPISNQVQNGIVKVG